MWVNQIQAAFVKAAVSKPVAGRITDRSVNQVIRVADRLHPRAPRENVKLSFRTAQKLRADGVIA